MHRLLVLLSIAQVSCADQREFHADVYRAMHARDQLQTLATSICTANRHSAAKIDNSVEAMASGKVELKLFLDPWLQLVEVRLRHDADGTMCFDGRALGGDRMPETNDDVSFAICYDEKACQPDLTESSVVP